MHATFLARPMSGEAGSALHIHQSIVDQRWQEYIFDEDGDPSELFYLVHRRAAALRPGSDAVFAPYPNSYRRLLSYWASPVNLEWAVDNRTVGLRVPDSDRSATRREPDRRFGRESLSRARRYAGLRLSGYGRGHSSRASPSEGSAYDLPFSLHRGMYAALEAFESSERHAPDAG